MAAAIGIGIDVMEPRYRLKYFFLLLLGVMACLNLLSAKVIIMLIFAILKKTKYGNEEILLILYNQQLRLGIHHH